LPLVEKIPASEDAGYNNPHREENKLLGDSDPMAKKSSSAKITSSVSSRAKKIRVLLMDVDGVLTDGRIWLLSRRDGTASEIKGFSAYDGAGLKLARAAGLRTGLITGRESSAVSQRARECEIEFVYQGRATSSAPTKKFCARRGRRTRKSPTSATIFPTFLYYNAQASP